MTDVIFNPNTLHLLDTEKRVYTLFCDFPKMYYLEKRGFRYSWVLKKRRIRGAYKSLTLKKVAQEMAHRRRDMAQTKALVL